MAIPSTLHRFKIRLSDVDRGLYETLDLRVARHPSESVPYLLTRVLAYALNVSEGLVLTDGLCNPDEPALLQRDLTGKIVAWIEVGNPSARRLHKAAKTAASVRVYTYKSVAILQQELSGEPIHRSEAIELFSFPPAFLDALGQTLGRDNAWELLHTDGELSVTVADRAIHGEMGRHGVQA